MIAKFIIWLLVAVGVFPVLLLTLIVVTTVISSPYTSAEGAPWCYRSLYGRLSDALVTTGTALKLAGSSITLYPRVWATVLGIIGVIFIFVCIYYTLHVPYKGENNMPNQAMQRTPYGRR